MYDSVPFNTMTLPRNSGAPFEGGQILVLGVIVVLGTAVGYC